VIALYEPGSFEEVPLDNMRRIIAGRLIEAKQTIPHFYLTADVTIERLLRFAKKPTRPRRRVPTDSRHTGSRSTTSW
jgi:Pyruvate/2-oxoglutarate dehydrogenase complex, dihydrolipoamide acyltransferase (E2) component, and related enzymes